MDPNRKPQKRATLVPVLSSQNHSNNYPPLHVEENHDYLRHWEGKGPEGDEIVDWGDLHQNEGEQAEILTEEEDLADDDVSLQPAEANYEHLRHWEGDASDGDKIVSWSDLDEDEGDDTEDDAESYGDAELNAAETAFIQARERKEARKRALSENVIVEIINESIETFSEKWKPGKGHELTSRAIKRAFDPPRLLREAEIRGNRKELIKRYQNDIEHFKHRLDELAEEILDRHGDSTQDEMRKLCQILGTHVENLEEAKWFLSVYGNALDGDFEGYIDDESDSAWSVENDDREMLVDVENPSDDPIIVDEESYPTSVSEVHRNDQGVQNKVHENDQGDRIPKAGTTTNRASYQMTTPIKPNTAPKLHVPRRDEPENSSILAISHWSMKDLVVRKDRKRIVMKVFRNLAPEQREMIRTRFQAVKKSNMLREIENCIDMFKRKEKRMLGVLPSDLTKIRTITHFFLCWWFGNDHMHETLSQEQLDELAVDLQNSDDLEFFYDWVEIILHKTFTTEAFRFAEEDIITISDDEAPP